MAAEKHILFCVLNWGLGHATRSLPLIHHLLRRGHRLTIASDGLALAFLQNENLPVEFETLDGYDVIYAETRLFQAMVKQGPGILNTVIKEHRQVKEIVRRRQIDMILSDSRFGCYVKKIPSYIIGHILQIRSKDSLTSLAVNKMIRYWTAKFDCCWVPDLPPPDHLSGYLSEASLKVPKEYLGWLTNLETMEVQNDFDLVAVLSGPEPLRTDLEAIVLDQLGRMDGRFIVIGGKPDAGKDSEIPGHIEFKPMASRQELSWYVSRSEVVLCRSGYSSLMDWLMLGKKMIVIPTPGQPEQEYLAEVLSNKKWAVTQTQTTLDIPLALMQADQLSPPSFGRDSAERFGDILDEALGK